MPVVNKEEFITARHVVFGNIKVTLPVDLTLQRLRNFMWTSGGLQVFHSSDRLLYIYPKSLDDIEVIPQLQNCTMADILVYRKICNELQS